MIQLELEKNIFNIFPNPTNGVFIIELDIAKKYDLNIHNVLGQSVYSRTTNSTYTKIDLSSFDKGIYTKSGFAHFFEHMLFQG